MAFSTELRVASACDRQGLSGNALQRFGGVTLLCVALACAWILWANIGPDLTADREPAAPPRPAALANAYAKLSADLKSYAERSAAAAGGTTIVAKTIVAKTIVAKTIVAKTSAGVSAAAKTYDKTYAKAEAAAKSTIALLDSHWLGAPPGTFVKGAALVADGEEAAPALGQSTLGNAQEAAFTGAIDRQAARNAAAPQLRSPPAREASLRAAAPPSLAAVPAEEPTIFEKLFGKPAPVALAYAAPDDAGLGRGQSIAAGRYDRSTAVYDISAHTVYLPDGTKLEAHSGYGTRLDDPRHPDERMRGVTPPTVYDLKLREAPFHGVQALRLIPVDEDKVYGRTGLLAHTFMLGPRGDSNGCVSIRNYAAFLEAYLKNKIKRLVVVSRLE
jgi:Protein of unknown function (DUF2778)